MFERGQQKSAELAPVPIRLAHGLLFQELLEESLRQILGVLRAVTTPANVGVKRMPIGTAELFECFVPSSVHTVRRAEHDAPVGGGEPFGLFCPGSAHRIQLGVNQPTSNLARLSFTMEAYRVGTPLALPDQYRSR